LGEKTPGRGSKKLRGLKKRLKPSQPTGEEGQRGNLRDTEYPPGGPAAPGREKTINEVSKKKMTDGVVRLN